jgi:cytochrome b561
MRNTRRVPKMGYSRRHSKPSIVLHWVSAGLMVSCWWTGWIYTHRIATNDPSASSAYHTHAAFGHWLLLSIVLYALIRPFVAQPAPPHNVGKTLQAMRRMVHGIMCVTLVIALASGGLMMALFPTQGLPALDGGIGATNTLHSRLFMHGITLHAALCGVHFLCAWMLASMSIVHVLAALFHHMVLRDDVLLRICPQRCHGVLNWLRGSRR